MARVKEPFETNKTYYNSENGWKLKYTDKDIEGYYNFKIIKHDDPVNDWIEYSTKDGSEVVLKYEAKPSDKIIE